MLLPHVVIFQAKLIYAFSDYNANACVVSGMDEKETKCNRAWLIALQLAATKFIFLVLA
jgi:hypothetical protein